MTNKEIEQEDEHTQNPISINSQVAEDGKHMKLVLRAFNMFTTFEMPIEIVDDVIEGLTKQVEEAQRLRVSLITNVAIDDDKELESLPKDGDVLEE